MRVALLVPELPADAPADERDALLQADAVRAALAANGHRTVDVAVGLDLGAVAAARVDCVFNLIEAFAGGDRGIVVVPALLETRGIPFTGAPLQAILMTTNKLVAKRLLREAGLPTPPWSEPGAGGSRGAAPPLGRVIVKPVWDHGSRGLDEGDVHDVATVEGLARLVAAVAPGRFVERYVPGREFNVALLDGPAGPQVLPPAEMLFEGYAAGRPRVVGYRAKWVGDSFESVHTVRRFDLAPADEALVAELRDLALACWSVCGLRGYARVDFRVDDGGRPWILEINVNPCLTPDAGFAAALERAGIPFGDAIERIVAAATATATAGEAVARGVRSAR